MIFPTFQRRLDAIRQNSFAKSAATLIGGTAFAQGLAILALPVLTRLYSPDDFRLLAIYASVLGILAAIACLRLEIAIPLPESETDAAALLALALLSSTTLALVAAAAIATVPITAMSYIFPEGIIDYLWMIPLGIWLSGLYAGSQYWATRRRRFSQVARTRISQSILGIGTQIIGGLTTTGAAALLLGHLVQSGSGALRLLFGAWRTDKKQLQILDWKKLAQVLLKYKKFPKYSTFEALANNSAIHIPVLLIASYSIGPEAGYLLLASRVLSAPLSLIGGALAQVYLSEAPNEMRKGQLQAYSLSVIKKLIVFGVAPLLLIGSLSPALFPWIFGEEWGRAGELVLWMTPWFALQLLTSPVSMSLHVTGNQQTAMMLQIGGAVFRTCVVLIAIYAWDKWISEAYALSGFLFYGFYALVICRCLAISARHAINALRLACLGTLPWLVPAALLQAYLHWM